MERWPSNKSDVKIILPKPKRESVQQAQLFLRQAQDDIKAAALLKSNGVYSLSIFHLQQSSEKTLKAEMLLSGLYKVDEIKKFSHNTQKAVKSLWGRIKVHLGIVGTDTPGDDYFTYLSDLLNKSPDFLRKLDHGTIKVILQTSTVDFVELNINPFWGEEFGQRACLGGFSVYYPLMTIAILTMHHESPSRYPDACENKIEYSSELGIVKATDDILTILSIANKFLLGVTEELIAQYEGNSYKRTDLV